MGCASSILFFLAPDWNSKHDPTGSRLSTDRNLMYDSDMQNTSPEHASVAQLVEQWPLKPFVVGSSPSRGTIISAFPSSR